MHEIGQEWKCLHLIRRVDKTMKLGEACTKSAAMRPRGMCTNRAIREGLSCGYDAAKSHADAASVETDKKYLSIFDPRERWMLRHRLHVSSPGQEWGGGNDGVYMHSTIPFHLDCSDDEGIVGASQSLKPMPECSVLGFII